MSDYEEAVQIINEMRVENERLWKMYCDAKDKLEQIAKENCYKSSITQSAPVKELNYSKMTTLTVKQRIQRLEATILACNTEIQKCNNELLWRECENRAD